MSDLPEQGLFQQMNARPVSGEHLEVLGKKASALWGSGEVATLTEAVVETIKHAGLSPEQVKRVIEFTNTDAFLTDFKKEGSHHVVNFQGGPADPVEILKDLNDGGGGSVFDRGISDYNHPPRSVKTASASLEKTASVYAEPDIVAQAFGAAEVGYPETNPFGEVFELRDKLASDNAAITAQLSDLESMYSDLSDRVYFHTKQAALSGESLGNIVQVWRAAYPSAEHVKIAFQLFTPRLMRDGVFTSGAALTSSIEKTGSARMVNTQHPLFSDYHDFCDVLSKLAELRAAQQDIGQGLVELDTFIQKNAGMAQTLAGAAKKEGIIPKVFRVARESAEPARKAVEGATQGVLGKDGAELAGAAAHKVVKYAPHAAAAVGVNEARRHLKYSPTWNKFQSVANPHSDQYQQREYELAQRGGYA